MTATEDFWSILANYESSDLVRARFREKHERTLGAAKAQEICAAFTQARGYIASARDADRIVRPLLVYYGVLSLARGLTLFLSRSLRETGLVQSHGLSVIGWADELSRQGGAISVLKVRINPNGTLRQLIDATEHQSFLRNNSSIPNLVVHCDNLQSESEFDLCDLLSRVPEIASVYRRWRDDRNMVPIWLQGDLPDGRREFRVGHGYNVDDVRAVLGDVASTSRETGGVVFIAIPRDAEIPSLSDVTGSWVIGDLVAMSKFPSGIELSKIATAYAVSYVLGMLVRYYPSHWIGMLQNRTHNAALPTLLAAMQYVETEFPRLIVEFLEKPVSLGSA